MRVKLSLLSLLFLLAISAQVTFAKEPAESLAVKAISENNAESKCVFLTNIHHRREVNAPAGFMAFGRIVHSTRGVVSQVPQNTRGLHMAPAVFLTKLSC